MPSLTLNVTPAQAARIQPMLERKNMTAEQFLLYCLRMAVLEHEAQERQRIAMQQMADSTPEEF